MIWVNQTMMICHSETGPYSLIYRVLSFWINDIICHICKQFEYQHQIIWILRNFTLCLLAFNLIFLVYLMWRSTHRLGGEIPGYRTFSVFLGRLFDVKAGHKKIARLMKEMNLKATIRKKDAYKGAARHDHPCTAPDNLVVERQIKYT